jgi:hypothetical protein
MKDIRIDVGVTTPLQIDLQEFPTNQKIIFTIKNMPFARTEAVVERELITDGSIKTIYITPEESIAILDNAEYDFNQIIANEESGELMRIKLTDNGKVKLRKGVGGGIA